jgi:hypothetical protein
MNCRVLYNELCVPVRTTGGIWTVEYSKTNYAYQSEHLVTQSSVYSTLQFIFHQLFWLVRRVRCTALYSSYSTSCSDWYAEFGVQYSTVHISPVVLTGTQSSMYSTQQFIFHQMFWLVRKVRCTVLHSSYSTSCSDWYAEFDVQHATAPGGICTVEYCTPNSAYQSEQLVEYELLSVVHRTLRTSQKNWWNMNCSVLYTELCVPVRTTGGIWTVEYCKTCSDWYAEFGVQYSTVHIPPVVLTGTQSSLYSTPQFIFHQLLSLVRRVRCTPRYSSYSTRCSD